jgi:hypothetical protein
VSSTHTPFLNGWLESLAHGSAQVVDFRGKQTKFMHELTKFQFYNNKNIFDLLDKVTINQEQGIMYFIYYNGTTLI